MDTQMLQEKKILTRPNQRRNKNQLSWNKTKLKLDKNEIITAVHEKLKTKIDGIKENQSVVVERAGKVDGEFKKWSRVSSKKE